MDFEDLSCYVQVANKFPLLSAKEERELASTILKFKTGKQKQAAREKLAVSNIKLVVKMACRYYRRLEALPCPTIPVFDLIGAGNKGLMVAVDQFRPDKFNTRFSTYSYRWIQQSITRFIYSFYDGVHVPLALADQLRRVLNMEAENESITDTEIMTSLNINEDNLDKIRSAYASLESLDIPVYVNGSGRPMNRIDAMVVKTSCHRNLNGDQPSDHAEKTDRKEILMEALSELEPRYRKVLEQRYLTYGQGVVPLKIIGKDMGITGERVRQLEIKAIRSLRKKIEYKIKYGRS